MLAYNSWFVFIIIIQHFSQNYFNTYVGDMYHLICCIGTLKVKTLKVKSLTLVRKEITWGRCIMYGVQWKLLTLGINSVLWSILESKGGFYSSCLISYQCLIWLKTFICANVVALKKLFADDDNSSSLIIILIF